MHVHMFYFLCVHSSKLRLIIYRLQLVAAEISELKELMIQYNNDYLFKSKSAWIFFHTSTSLFCLIFSCFLFVFIALS